MPLKLSWRPLPYLFILGYVVFIFASVHDCDRGMENFFSEDVAEAAGMNGHIPRPVDVNLLYKLMAAHIFGGKPETRPAYGQKRRICAPLLVKYECFA